MTARRVSLIRGIVGAVLALLVAHGLGADGLVLVCVAGLGFLATSR